MRSQLQAVGDTLASLLQPTQAGLWLTGLACTGLFAAGSADIAKVFFGWPSGWLLTASACAFVCTLMTVATLIMAPWIWRGGRRVDSWNGLRKFSYTCTALIFGSFAMILAAWGFLEFWNA